MINIPAVPYMTIVKDYAIAKGLPFFTWKQQEIAVRLYEEHAKLNN